MEATIVILVSTAERFADGALRRADIRARAPMAGPEKWKAQRKR